MSISTVLLAQVFALVPAAQWPTDYTCRVVSSELETMTFDLWLSETDARISEDVLGFAKETAVPLRKDGVGLKSGDNYLRALASSDRSRGNLLVIQQGIPENPMTHIQINDRPESENDLAQANEVIGICVIRTGELYQ